MGHWEDVYWDITKSIQEKNLKNHLNHQKNQSFGTESRNKGI